MMDLIEIVRKPAPGRLGMTVEEICDAAGLDATHYRKGVVREQLKKALATGQVRRIREPRETLNGAVQHVVTYASASHE